MKKISDTAYTLHYCEFIRNDSFVVIDLDNKRVNAHFFISFFNKC